MWQERSAYGNIDMHEWGHPATSIKFISFLCVALLFGLSAKSNLKMYSPQTESDRGGLLLKISLA